MHNFSMSNPYNPPTYFHRLSRLGIWECKNNYSRVGASSNYYQNTQLGTYSNLFYQTNLKRIEFCLTFNWDGFQLEIIFCSNCHLTISWFSLLSLNSFKHSLVNTLWVEFFLDWIFFHSIEFFFVPWLIDQTPDCCRNFSSTETTGNKKLIIQNAWLGNDNIINVVEIPPAGW